MKANDPTIKPFAFSPRYKANYRLKPMQAEKPANNGTITALSNEPEIETMAEQNDYAAIHKRLNTSHVNTRGQRQELRINSDLTGGNTAAQQPVTVRANITPRKKHRGEGASTSQKSKQYQKMVQQRLKQLQGPSNQKGKFRFGSNDSADSN